MAWRFRRSLKFGLFRLNFSKSGIGYSAGIRGFRIGKTAKGTPYTAASIPGTGLYNRQYYPGAGKGTAQSGDNPTDGSTSAPQQAGTGNGISLLIAFLAGGVVVAVVMAMLSSPSVAPPTPITPPPAAAVAPVESSPVKPVKRRAHRPKKAIAPLPASDAAPPAN
jgi:hypothetical protein